MDHTLKVSVLFLFLGEKWTFLKVGFIIDFFNRSAGNILNVFTIIYFIINEIEPYVLLNRVSKGLAASIGPQAVVDVFHQQRLEVFCLLLLKQSPGLNFQVFIDSIDGQILRFSQNGLYAIFS